MAKFKVGDKVNHKSGYPKGGKIIREGSNGIFWVRWLDDLYGTRGYKEGELTAANSLVSTNAVVANALAARTACNATMRDSTGRPVSPSEIRRGAKFSPYDDSRMTFKVGRVKKDSQGYWVEPDIMNGEDDWYHISETVWRNSSLAARGAVAKNGGEDDAVILRALIKEARAFIPRCEAAKRKMKTREMKEAADVLIEGLKKAAVSGWQDWV